MIFLNTTVKSPAPEYQTYYTPALSKEAAKVSLSDDACAK
jgi:hypothetical protein